MAESLKKSAAESLDPIDGIATQGRPNLGFMGGDYAVEESGSSSARGPQTRQRAPAKSRPPRAGEIAGSDGSMRAGNRPTAQDRKSRSGRDDDDREAGDGERPPAVANFFDADPASNLPPLDNHPIGGTIIGLTGPAGARLSVAVEFEIPANHVSRTFRYIGSGSKSSPAAASSRAADLDLSYENSRDGSVFRLFLAVAVLCVFWFVRQRSIRTRAVLGALGITLPLGLIAVTPVSWHIILDGLFFGSLAGVVLWFAANRVNA
jgi:hypothetical protein